MATFAFIFVEAVLHIIRRNENKQLTMQSGKSTISQKDIQTTFPLYTQIHVRLSLFSAVPVPIYLYIFVYTAKIYKLYSDVLFVLKEDSLNGPVSEKNHERKNKTVLKLMTAEHSDVKNDSVS